MDAVDILLAAKLSSGGGGGGGGDAEDIAYDNTESGLTAEDVQAAIDELTSEKVNENAIVSAVSSASTNAQIPGAKLFYDTVGNVEAALNAIRGVTV